MFHLSVQHEREHKRGLSQKAAHRAHEVSERSGEVLGALVAPVFALTSALRRARTFHPEGDCADAEVTVSNDVPPPFIQLATRLCGMAFVRFSDALTKKRARWPDVLGCAIRFGDYVDDPASHGDQDLLFATIKRPWTMPFSPLTTHVRDYFDNDYFAVSPFALSGHEGRFYFRLRPAKREGAFESAGGPTSTLRTSMHRSSRTPAEQRTRRLERTIATGSSRLVLGVGRSPWGPFAPLVDIELVSVRLDDPAGLRFDPFHAGRGIEPHGFVHGLRRGVYSASQFARAEVTR